MGIRIAEHCYLQPVTAGFHVSLGRKFMVVDAAGSRILAACASGTLAADEILARASAESGEPQEKLQPVLKNLLSLGILVSNGSAVVQPPERSGVRVLPEAEIPAPPLADPEKALRFRRQTLLRPAPDGFQVWSVGLRARVTLAPETIRLLPLFAPPGQVISKALAAAGGDAQRTADAVSRLMAAGVLIPAELPKVVVAAPAPAPAKPRAYYQRDASKGDRIPVYCVAAGQPGYPPLALGLMVAYAKAYKGGALNERYDFIPDWLDSLESAEESHRRNGSGVWLFSSYLWSEKHALEISKRLKEKDPESVMVFGGPSAPKYEGACEAYFKANKQVDILVRGEGEITCADALDHLSRPLRDYGDGRLAEVQGLTFRARDGKVVRTPDRPREKDLSTFPSPYLTGLFDNLTARDNGTYLKAMIFETNRGCPYGCTFCDWGSSNMLQKINKFPMERVEAELDWLGRNKIKQIWCGDANLGIFDRDVEIAKMIVRTREKYGYPTQMTVNYAKNATERHAEILKIFTQGGVHAEGILSIQSTSEQTLKTIRRQNIKTQRYDELAEVFRAEGLSFSSDLMIGLPGDTVESFKNSLQHFFDRHVYVQAYPTVLLPNSPMADPDYMKENKIVTFRNVVVESFSYSLEDYRQMLRIAGYYSLLVNFALLRYVLYYLQYDHGLRAVDVLHKLVKTFAFGDAQDRYPVMSWLMNRYRAELDDLAPERIVVQLDAPGSWEDLYAEVKTFLVKEFAIPDDAALDTVLAVQAAILPREEEPYPLTVELPHDFVSYLEARRQASRQAAQGDSAVTAKRLGEHGPGRMVVTDPEALSTASREQSLRRDHIVMYELESALKSWSARPAFSTTMA